MAVDLESITERTHVLRMHDKIVQKIIQPRLLPPLEVAIIVTAFATLNVLLDEGTKAADTDLAVKAFFDRIMFADPNLVMIESQRLLELAEANAPRQ